LALCFLAYRCAHEATVRHSLGHQCEEAGSSLDMLRTWFRRNLGSICGAHERHVS